MYVGRIVTDHKERALHGPQRNKCTKRKKQHLQNWTQAQKNMGRRYINDNEDTHFPSNISFGVEDYDAVTLFRFDV